MAQEQAKLERQAAGETAKLERMAEEHRVTEAQQAADLADEAADKAAREGAAQAEQKQLRDLARQAEQRAQDVAAGGSVSGSSSSDSSAASSDSLPKSERRTARKAAKAAGLSADEYQAQAQGDGSGRWPADNPKTSMGGRRGGKGVRATYHYYAPAYETSSLYCADRFWGREKSLLERPWVSGGGRLAQPPPCSSCMLRRCSCPAAHFAFHPGPPLHRRPPTAPTAFWAR